MATIYARFLNQNKFKNQTVISLRFDKRRGENQVLDETELIINLEINHNLTETDIDIFDIKSLLEHQIQIQETKDSGWRFDKIISMTICFYKTSKMNGSTFVKFQLRSFAILNNESVDK